jgi:hypothetical protein
MKNIRRHERRSCEQSVQFGMSLDGFADRTNVQRLLLDAGVQLDVSSGRFGLRCQPMTLKITGTNEQTRAKSSGRRMFDVAGAGVGNAMGVPVVVLTATSPRMGLKDRLSRSSRWPEAQLEAAKPKHCPD